MDSLLATSPQSVTGRHFPAARFTERKPRTKETGPISLTQLQELLPGAIEESRRLVAEGSVGYGSEEDPITKLYQ